MFEKLLALSSLCALAAGPLLIADEVTLVMKDGREILANTSDMRPGGVFSIRHDDGSVSEIKRADVQTFKFPPKPVLLPSHRPIGQESLTQASQQSVPVEAKAKQPTAPITKAQQLNTPEARAQFAMIRDSMLKQYEGVGDTGPAVALANELYEKMASGEMAEADLAALGKETLAEVDKYKEEREAMPHFEGGISQLSAILSRQ